MSLSNKFNFLNLTKKENLYYLHDYKIADKLFSIFTILWCLFQINVYQELITRPESLYSPMVWFQRLFMPTLPSNIYFSVILTTTLFFSLLRFLYPYKITYRIIVFIGVLWLNALKWNYNFFSHVGHLFLLAHFLSLFLTPHSLVGNVKKKVSEIRIFQFGILFTYTFAGVWKIGGLTYKILFTNKMSWLHPQAVELNTIVSLRLNDHRPLPILMKIYEIPFLWEILTLIIFLTQFFAIIGSFNKKLSAIILFFLVSFHLYNSFFIETDFYVSPIVLMIFFFPFHKLNPDYALKNR